jgi:hypothetical protein
MNPPPGGGICGGMGGGGGPNWALASVSISSRKAPTAKADILNSFKFIDQ